MQEYLEFRQINQSFAAVGAYRTSGGAYTTGEVNLTAGDRPLRVRSISVDAHLLNTLGVQPAQGRFFSEEETDRGPGRWRHRSRFSRTSCGKPPLEDNHSLDRP